MWPRGPGQLTVHGMKQHHELGSYLRKTYADFIPKDYNPDDVYIRSTDVDRTLMSAQSNAAAMFNNQTSLDSGTEKLPAEIDYGLYKKWLPLPVHTAPKPEEMILSFPIRQDRCPKYAEYEQLVRSSPKFKEYEAEHGEFIRNIAKQTGFNDTDDIGVAQEWELYDPLYCTNIHGYDMPEFFNDDVLTQLATIWTKGAFALFSDFEKKYHTQMTRINAGNLIQQLQKDMRLMLKQGLNSDPADGGDPNKPHKIRIYSGHDTTLVALLVALDKYDMAVPNYTAALIFEVYDDNSVVMKYRNDRTKEPEELQLCTQSRTCLFDQWVAETKHLIADDWAAECGIVPKSSEGSDQSNYLMLMTLLLGTWLGIGATFFYNRFYKVRRNEPPYGELVQESISGEIH